MLAEEGSGKKIYEHNENPSPPPPNKKMVVALFCEESHENATILPPTFD
jgi:hypothetical protein